MFFFSQGGCCWSCLRIAITMSGTVDGRTERFEKPWFLTFVMCPDHQINSLLDKLILLDEMKV